MILIACIEYMLPNIENTLEVAEKLMLINPIYGCHTFKQPSLASQFSPGIIRFYWNLNIFVYSVMTLEFLYFSVLN